MASLSDFPPPATTSSSPTDTDKPDGQGGRYYDYKVGNEYEYDSGKVVMPVAGPDGTPPQIVKLYAAIGTRSMPFSALKTDTPPLVPRIATDTVEGDVFLNGTLSLPLPQINANQTGFNYKASGRYEFVQPGAPRGYNATDTFQSGTYPFMIPLLSALAKIVFKDATVEGSGDPNTTIMSSTQIVPSSSGSGTKAPDWAWLSPTTWLPSFFTEPDGSTLLPASPGG